METPLPAVQPSVEQARAILAEGLKDKSPDTRKQAVSSLGLVGPQQPHLGQIQSMLQDKDMDVRLAAITSLVDVKTDSTASLLRGMLDDEVPEVAFSAAKALWALGQPDGKEALLSVLSGETKISSGFLSKQKREVLRMTHTPKMMFLTAARVGAVFAPVPGLGFGISSLQSILSDPGLSGRAATALLLAGDKDPAVLQALRDALDDKDWSVRAAGVHALALRDNPAFQADLKPLMEDKKEAVRLRAAAGYLRLETVR